VDWQNDEVFVPRWSTGTFACTSDKGICLVASICPCYAYNRIWQEAEIKPNPCPCFGFVTYMFCISFFPCIGCFARQHLSVKYGITPTYPQKDVETGRDARLDAAEDFCCHLCCHPCTLCQELREIKNHNAGRQGRTYVGRSDADGVPPPPPPADGELLEEDEGGEEGAGVASPPLPQEDDGERAAPAGGSHRAAMGAPALEMVR
jgi:Cys-rich protein (TIGR01571 family)